MPELCYDTRGEGLNEVVRRRAAGTVWMLHQQDKFYNHVIISRDYPKEREKSTAASDSGFPFSAGRGLPAELLRPESLPGEFFCGRPESGRNRAYGRAVCPARFPFLPRASKKTPPGRPAIISRVYSFSYFFGGISGCDIPFLQKMRYTGKRVLFKGGLIPCDFL